MKTRALAALTLAGLLFSNAAFAEDINEIFRRVNEYVGKENYSKALEELSWAKKEIEKMNTGKITKLLPPEVNGYKGADPKVNNALGMMNIERSYKNGSKQIEVSLTGSMGGGNEGMGGLAGLARMGMMMDSQPGSETFRIEGRTANLRTEGSRPELTVILESGAMLKLEGRNNVEAAELKSFAESMKVTPLDNYLKGVQ